MHNAHAMYSSAGFSKIEAYAGSEIPEPMQEHWLFMELNLT